MALQANVRRLKVQLSDVDRGVYEALDLRLAQHPSETDAYLVTRVLAYCLSYEEGIAFSHGLSNVDEPAVWVKTPDGRTTAWIEVGTPSAERLHRASKASERVAIFTQHDPALILREAARMAIHRVEAIQLFVPNQGLIRELAERVERSMSWELSCSGGQLYVTIGSNTLEGDLRTMRLKED